MDTKTFVRHFLVGEITGNIDTYWSVYLYKQRNDDKFYFGPVWDFDLAYENDNRVYPVNNKSGWLYLSGSAAGDTRGLVTRLLSDQALLKELKDTYAEYRNKGVITTEKLLAVVDNYVTEIDQSQKLNFRRWDILSQRVHQNNQPAGSYLGEINIVKNYIRDRIKWMDKKLSYVPTDLKPLASSTFTVQAQTNAIHIGGINEPVSIEVFDTTGNRVSKVVTGTNTSIPSRKGVYVVRILPSNGESSTVIKCIVE
jgi:hypothetical protein